MSKFVIRKATENDAESLLKIYEPYITNTTITFEYEVPTAEAFADRIRETAAAFPYLVCERDGMIMGYAYAHRIRERAAYDWDAELSIYLAQGTHGHGVGTTVLACLIDLLELQGCATCTAA
ncbi:N-acetyltransferase [Butyricicoccus sp. AF22-28AC]|nr:GNAT family N-acetyltransferase [Butyricicoccus sp. AF22-28AC]RHQ81114.1 N-acetyltransferase [Butyricicoccus sp. AF22-28AC]